MNLLFRCFLPIFFILFIARPASCQVVVLESYVDKVFIGPENVSIDKFLVTPYYLQLLNNKREEIINLIVEGGNLQTELNEKKKFIISKKRSLRKVKEVLRIYEKDLLKIDSLLFLWNNLAIFQESLLEADNIIKAGRCIEFQTNMGIIYSDEVKIEFKAYNRPVEWKEIISIEYTKPRSEWKKVNGDRNCQSADPNDCIVWCLVENKNSVKFYDITGGEQNMKSCPEDFVYNPKYSECQKRIELEEDYELLETLVLVRNGSEEIIIPLSWKMVDCD